jgi:hypothetical protein
MLWRYLIVHTIGFVLQTGCRWYQVTVAISSNLESGFAIIRSGKYIYKNQSVKEFAKKKCPIRLSFDYAIPLSVSTSILFVLMKSCAWHSKGFSDDIHGPAPLTIWTQFFFVFSILCNDSVVKMTITNAPFGVGQVISYLFFFFWKVGKTRERDWILFIVIWIYLCSHALCLSFVHHLSDV